MLQSYSNLIGASVSALILSEHNIWVTGLNSLFVFLTVILRKNVSHFQIAEKDLKNVLTPSEWISIVGNVIAGKKINFPCSFINITLISIYMITIIRFCKLRKWILS